MSQRIGLTGATGFIGRSLIKHLRAFGHPVRALARRPQAVPAEDGLEVLAGDLDSRSALDALVKDCDAVIHLAGAIAGRNYADFARVNAVGTGHLIQAMEHRNPQARLILISSLAAREPELSHYAASKRVGELMVETSTLDWFILRPPAVYGPDDPALAPLWRTLARGWLLRAGPAKARFSLIHVDDLCSALIGLLGMTSLGCRTACLDDGRPDGYSWADIAELATRRGSRRVRTLPLPRSLLSAIAWLNLHSSRMRTTPPILVPGKVRELTHKDWVCDSRLIEALPDWSPQRSLETELLELPGWKK